MNDKTRRALQWLLLAALSVALYGFSTGPPVGFSGVPSDNNPLACTQCHRSNPLNSGPGRVRIQAEPYMPGATQTIRVTVEDPEAVRWGFQMAARLKSDDTRQAGDFGTTADVQVRCKPNNRNAPCGDDHQYAMHTQPGTSVGTTGSRTFEIPWTAPATNVGPVVFYVAANAANNSGNNVGDQIYTSTMEVAAATCNIKGRPVITGVSNAASRGPISSNALISIYGSGFAAANARYAASSTGADWPREIGCVAVEVGGRRAPVFFVSGNQINAQTPILQGTGDMDVRVVLNPGTPNEIRGDATRVQVAAVAPALFTDGRYAVAHRQDGTMIGPDSPAKPGEVVVVYGSGFGFTDPVFQPGEFAFGNPVLRGVSVTLGGRPVTDVLFSGLSSAAPGLYRFDWRVPADTLDGDAALVLRAGGTDSQTGVMIPVRR
jgi:uncharacterized protein (TIGR03437 family)